nr:MAG TPA: protein of unknown function (DUF5405) [Caudoviricetes sp.]
MYINLSGNYYIKSQPRCFVIGCKQKNSKGEVQFVAKWYFTSLRSALRAMSKAKSFQELKNDIRALNDEMEIIIEKINKGISDDKNRSDETMEILSEFEEEEEIE